MFRGDIIELMDHMKITCFICDWSSKKLDHKRNNTQLTMIEIYGVASKEANEQVLDAEEDRQMDQNVEYLRISYLYLFLLKSRLYK